MEIAQYLSQDLLCRWDSYPAGAYGITDMLLYTMKKCNGDRASSCDSILELIFAQEK